MAATLPVGYFLEYGGQFENQQRAMKRLGIVVPVSIGLIFLMLFSGLGTIRSALMVFANLPFALVGGVLAEECSSILKEFFRRKRKGRMSK